MCYINEVYKYLRIIYLKGIIQCRSIDLPNNIFVIGIPLNYYDAKYHYNLLHKFISNIMIYIYKFNNNNNNRNRNIDNIEKIIYSLYYSECIYLNEMNKSFQQQQQQHELQFNKLQINLQHQQQQQILPEHLIVNSDVKLLFENNNCLRITYYNPSKLYFSLTQKLSVSVYIYIYY